MAVKKKGHHSLEQRPRYSQGEWEPAIPFRRLVLERGAVPAD